MTKASKSQIANRAAQSAFQTQDGEASSVYVFVDFDGGALVYRSLTELCDAHADNTIIYIVKPAADDEITHVSATAQAITEAMSTQDDLLLTDGCWEYKIQRRSGVSVPDFDNMSWTELSAWYIANVGYDAGAEDPSMSLEIYREHCMEMFAQHIAQDAEIA